MKTPKRQTRALAFVTNELFIVLGLFGVGLGGAVVLTRWLHLGLLASVGVVFSVLFVIYLGLSLLDGSVRRKRP
jgi:hypothetical protein